MLRVGIKLKIKSLTRDHKKEKEEQSNEKKKKKKKRCETVIEKQEQIKVFDSM